MEFTGFHALVNFKGTEKLKWVSGGVERAWRSLKKYHLNLASRVEKWMDGLRMNCFLG
jgi:hypothetical protein